MKTADDLTKFYSRSDLFSATGEYHQTLSSWVYNLIVSVPNIPNAALPSQMFQLPNGEGNSVDSLAALAEKLGNSNMTLTKALVLVLPNIPLYLLVAMKVLPWLIPVLYSLMGVVLVCTPQLLDWYQQFSQKKKDSEEDRISENPLDWITQKTQVMSDKYDAIVGLIMIQDARKEQLPTKYGKKFPELYSRCEQEKKFFPTECLNVVRDIMIFCNNCYMTWRMELVHAVELSKSPPATNQFRQQGPLE
jgi:hypothetical protein